ncbi:MAG: hypothetical protein NVSMB7_09970 [Chitinophagaceae bacterium]
MQKSSTPKDYTASIKEKTWSGMLTYTSQTTEYYSVHFNTDNSLIWSQLSGDYIGHWAINGKQLTLTFTNSNAQIKADISDADTLMNIVANVSLYIINSGKLLANPTVSLDNTVWKGLTVTGAASSFLQMSFMPGSKVEVKVSTVPETNTYTRSASGAVIRTVFKSAIFFGIITSNNEIHGSINNPKNTWYVIKQ